MATASKGGSGLGLSLVDSGLCGSLLGGNLDAGIGLGNCLLHGVELGLKGSDFVRNSFVSSLVCSYAGSFVSGEFGCRLNRGDKGVDSFGIYSVVEGAFGSNSFEGGFGLCL